MISIGDIGKLSKFEFLKKIEKEDREGYSYLKQIAKYLINNNKFIDDHRHKGSGYTEIYKILIVRTYIQTKSDKNIFRPKNYRIKYDDTIIGSGLWTTPFFNKVRYLCKNPLYLDINDYLHLCTGSIGYDLDPSDCKQLKKNNKLVQEHTSAIYKKTIIELNFLFSIEEMYSFMWPISQYLYKSNIGLDIDILCINM